MISRLTQLKRRIKRHHVLIALSAALLLFGSLALWASSLSLPDLKSFEERKVQQSTKIYDRTGKILLYDLHGNAQRTVIPYDQMPRFIKNATIAIEDESFYQHHGIKISSIIRATFANLTSGGFSQGGSTITQQVVKNSLLTGEKTIARKLKEWVLAVKLERVISKDEILGLYLNETPYGGSLYGVESASESYFGKSAGALTLAESAYLAALPQAPTYYSPYGAHRDKLENRKNLVLKKMLDLGFITKEEYADAQAEKVNFNVQEDNTIKAPHFVFYIREYLEQKYGQDAIERGLKVTTTLNYDLERDAEDIVAQYAAENTIKFNATNAGMVAVDPKTGQILVMVGSRDYFDPDIQGNFNITTASRQPGSSFKPFVYAEAMIKGYTPSTIVFDLKTQFSTACKPDDFSKETPCFSPDNYDNIFRGPVTLREALAQSLNIPSVQVLYLAGITDSLKLAKDLGITTLTDAARYGLSLVLGGGEVRLLDMVGAYAVFANDGVRNTPTGILKVEDSSGVVLEEYQPHPASILDPQIARTLNDMLSDNESRTPAFGENSALYFPGHDVAAKTGTTNDYRDAWILGYTPSLAVGAWAGNNDNTPMEKKVAGFIVAPLWHAFMEKALATLPNDQFITPDPLDPTTLKPILQGLWQGGESYTIDTVSGKLATDYTPKETRQIKVSGDIHSILYYVDKDNPRGATPANPSSDPQFSHWEYPLMLWKQAGGYGGGSGVRPTGYDDVHTPANMPHVTITSPTQNSTVDGEKPLLVQISSQGRYPATKVDFYVNGILQGSSNRFPFSFSFTPADTADLNQQNELRVVLYDSVFDTAEAVTSFTVR
ncbi:MAG TPA: PBP1A family penicillin-binding protein [Candidatus Paceibacterota bacterium]